MTKKILSAMLMVLGICMTIFGNNMSNTVAQGEQRVSDVEQETQDNRRPVLGPVRRNIRTQEAETTQEKIADKKQELTASQVTANWIEGCGIALFLVGLTCFIFSNRRKA